MATSNGASRDYKSGQKNNWRRWAWNEISRRVSNRRDALVIYMPGWQDLERSVAVDHGFRPDNMIAIEKNILVAQRLRKKGVITINSDLLAILAAWPEEAPPIAVISADFCSGLAMKHAILLDATLKKPLSNTVFLANFLRGRDESSNTLREIVQKVMRWDDQPLETKHRGVLFLLSYALLVCYDQSLRSLPIEQIAAALKTFLVGLNPKSFSYKSGPQIMDSVIYESPWRNLAMTQHYLRIGSSTFPRERKNISAALAVRTMRMNGTLPHSPSE